jgi:PAS domain-containing protein
MIDGEGTVVGWTSTAQRLVGYAAGEVVGRPAWFVLPFLRLCHTRSTEENVRGILLGSQLSRRSGWRRITGGKVVCAEQDLPQSRRGQERRRPPSRPRWGCVAERPEGEELT